MVSLPYWRIDAFIDGPGSGNPAAIIECERWPDDAAMTAIASETGGTATAFLVPDESSAADWQVRWFSPLQEIQLCGHATLAAANMLLGRDDADRVAFRTRRAGVLEASRSEAGLEIGLPAIETQAGEWEAAAALIGCEPLETYRSEAGYAVFVLAEEDQVRSLAPDYAGLAELGNNQITCTAPGHSADVVSRVFTPNAISGEDIATGSAHAALAPIWARKLERDAITAIQASPRGGKLHIQIDGDRVWLGGKCQPVIEGRFYLSG